MPLTPFTSAATMPSSLKEPGCPRKKVDVLALPCKRFLSVVEDRKIAGSTKGSRILALKIAGWRRSRLARRLDLRLARISGLSWVVSRPSVVQVQVCASPSTVPGRLLISTRNRPAGDKTSASTSLILPSSSMNSKLVQTFQGARSGSWLRSHSSASRSQGKLDSAITCQRLPPMLMVDPQVLTRQFQTAHPLDT